MSDRVVYLMRGLPSSGKSWTARRLAGVAGRVLETDAYFYTQQPGEPATYQWRAHLLPAARRWNFERYVQVIADQISPIVVDRGNSWNEETRRYAQYALDQGYRVELKEPESEWWQEIRVLLKTKDTNTMVLYQWAERLAEMSQRTHCVPASTIRQWMDSWKHDLTIDDIVNRQSPSARRS